MVATMFRGEDLAVGGALLAFRSRSSNILSRESRIKARESREPCFANTFANRLLSTRLDCFLISESFCLEGSFLENRALGLMLTTSWVEIVNFGLFVVTTTGLLIVSRPAAGGGAVEAFLVPIMELKRACARASSAFV